MNEGAVQCPVCGCDAFVQMKVMQIAANIRVIPMGEWPGKHIAYTYTCNDCGYELRPVVDEHGDSYSSTPDGLGGD